jgi:hypothetical protein
MTESKSTEQNEQVSKSVGDWSSEEIQAEIERLDQEAAQEPPEPAPRSQGRASGASTNGETLAREVRAIRRDLLRQYESWDGDEKYTDEHRAEQQWAAYDKARPLIESKASAAREKLLESADHLERSSIPFPGGQSLRTDSVELLSLTQGERSRIVERLSYEHPNIARMKAAGKNVPTSSEERPANILREEYSRGLAVGGVQGGAICRAAISLAEDRGMSVDDIVDDHRRDWQKSYLQDAQQARIQARSLYAKVPLPSSKRPGGAQSLEESRAGKRRTPFGAIKKASKGPTFPKRKKRSSWK